MKLHSPVLRLEGRFYVAAFQLLIMSGMISGLFLWGLVKWSKRSKAKARSEDNSCRKTNGENRFVFQSSLPSPPPPPLALHYPPDPWTVSVTDLVIDPETEYVQVLTDARNFLSNAKATEKHTAGSASRAEPEDRAKSKSSWRKSWLFRPLSKKEAQQAQTVSFSPREQRKLKRSMSGPLQHSRNNCRQPFKNKSGPIYTDGMPIAPANRNRTAVGSLSASVTPERFYYQESPYQQLTSSQRSLCRPIYTV